MVDHQTNIIMYGGKAASLLAQYHAGNGGILLPFSIIRTNEWEAGQRYNFSYEHRQIVRGSTIGDHKGMVDVIPTLQYQSNVDLNGTPDRMTTITDEQIGRWRQGEISMSRMAQLNDDNQEVYETNLALVRRNLEKYPRAGEYVAEKGKPSCIDDIIAQSRKPEVVLFANREGLANYQGVESVLIQPQNREQGYNLKRYRRGSVVEHPNIEGHYLINVYLKVESGNIYIDQALVNAKGNIIAAESMGDNSITPEIAKIIIQTKQRSRKAGFTPEERASQMEFLFLDPSQDYEQNKYQFPANPANPILFAQERWFLPFAFDKRINPKRYLFNHFGKIPEEGLELRVVRVGDISGPDGWNRTILDDGTPSVYVMSSLIRAESGVSLGFQPGNMVGFVVPRMDGEWILTSQGNSLEHNTYRFAQQAQFSALCLPVDGRNNYQHYTTGETIRITPKSIINQIPSILPDSTQGRKKSILIKRK